MHAFLYSLIFAHFVPDHFLSAAYSSKNNIIGLLFVKDLIFIDPEDETPIRNFVQIFGRNVHVVWPVDKLGDVLRELKEGRSHMALVRDVVSDGDCDPYYEIKGIITLEGKVISSFHVCFCTDLFSCQCLALSSFSAHMLSAAIFE